jgi:hypothetical protein
MRTEAFRKLHEVRIGEIAGDQAVAVALGLDAADIAELNTTATSGMQWRVACKINAALQIGVVAAGCPLLIPILRGSLPLQVVRDCTYASLHLYVLGVTFMLSVGLIVGLSGKGATKMSKDMHPIVVCVINLKGGVGKSTISALLARRGYTHRNLDVLAIDLDPQANLSQGLMHDDYTDFLRQQRPSIVEIFNGYVPPRSGTSVPTALHQNSAVVTVAEAYNRSLQLSEIKVEAEKNGWHIYNNEIEHSRGYPKMMRGDNNWLGNAKYFSMFADEFFESMGI